MSEHRFGLDIAKNIKVIEWLKTELLDGLANLSKAMIKNSEDLITDALAGIVVICYLLARRLGIHYSKLDQSVAEKVDFHKDNKHEVEMWYGDLSSFHEYLKDREQMNRRNSHESAIN